jgi:hypothetical protein
MSGPIPDSPSQGQFGDFSDLITTANPQLGGPGFAPVNFVNDFSTLQPNVHVVHVDVSVTHVDAALADKDAISFDLPLSQLEAALDGDVVSVTASLADGQPLPGWLHFNGDTGQFAGLLPDYMSTASIGNDGDGDGGHDGGINGVHNGQPRDPNLPPIISHSITIEVVARDSHGNLAITDFTIDLSTLKPHGNDKHGWNVPRGDGLVDPLATNRRDRAFAAESHGEFAPLHAMDRVAWHQAAVVDFDRGHHGRDLAPAGRAGLSDQIKGLGWHAASAERMALLESLRQGVAGWR